jgi:hypothetical protein
MTDRTGSPRGSAPYVDTQSLTDSDTYVYETVATLEFTGRRPSRAEIAAATDLDDESIDATLDALTRQGLLTKSEDGGEAVYVPAQRSWSTRPDQATGHLLP